MVHRFALFAASLAASAVLVVGLTLAGFPAGPTPATVQQVQDVAATAATPVEPTVQVDTVYVAPAAKPKQVTITKATTPARHGDNEGDGGDDD